MALPARAQRARRRRALAGPGRRRAATGRVSGASRRGGPGRRPPPGPAGPAARRRGSRGPALGQQFDRPLDRDRVHVVAPAQRGVGFPVGHVRAVRALLDHDREARGRVLPEFPQRRGGGTAATVLGLVEQFLGLGERDGEKLLLAIEGTTVTVLLHIGAVASVL